MSTSLNHSVAIHAASLIQAGKVNHAETWEAPSTESEGAYTEKNGADAARQWYLDAPIDGTKKEPLSFPFTHNFEEVSSAGIQACITRAAQMGYPDIQHAAQHLYEMCKRKEAQAQAEAAFGSMQQVNGRLVVDQAETE